MVKISVKIKISHQPLRIRTNTSLKDILRLTLAFKPLSSRSLTYKNCLKGIENAFNLDYKSFLKPTSFEHFQHIICLTQFGLLFAIIGLTLLFWVFNNKTPFYGGVPSAQISRNFL